MMICINASPYNMGKRAMRRNIYRAAARRYNKPVVYVNQVGGNDQLVFDGTSFAMNGAGEVIAAACSFDEDLVLCDLDAGTGDRHENLPDECEAVYQALVLGTRDYIRKCGFSRVLIGLSGGIDSSLTAAIAVEAVGRENVTGVAMPGPYSSEHSLMDARDRTGVKIGEAFMVRTHPQWLRTREIARSGAIGELRAIVAAFSYFNRDPGNIRNKADIGGGALMDIGCYPIQIARFLFGQEPVRVMGRMERDPDFGFFDFGRQLRQERCMSGEMKQPRQAKGSAGQFRSPIAHPAETFSISHLSFHASLKFFPLGVCFG